MRTESSGNKSVPPGAIDHVRGDSDRLPQRVLPPENSRGFYESSAYKAAPRAPVI
jgi:hypothetical protein